MFYSGKGMNGEVKVLRVLHKEWTGERNREVSTSYTDYSEGKTIVEVVISVKAGNRDPNDSRFVVDIVDIMSSSSSVTGDSLSTNLLQILESTQFDIDTFMNIIKRTFCCRTIMENDMAQAFIGNGC